MRIVSQNVAKRLPRSGAQLVANIVEHGADVVALQEITGAQADGWCTLLGAAGYKSVVRGVGYGTKGGALLASRLTLSPVQLHRAEVAGPRVAAGTVAGLSIASLYFPTGRGATGWSSLYDDLMLNPVTPTFVLIGDFQMAVCDIEISSGTFPRWQRDPSYVAMQHMLGHWRDAFRTAQGPHRVAYSHRHNSGASWLNDHALVPPGITVLGCEIDGSPIERGLSDHAALILDVESPEL